MSRHSFGAYDSAMLSDEGDLYSDEDEAGSYNGDLRNSLGDKNSIPTAADRRAHHNALERKRRDHIKDSFTSLRDSVPSLQGEKVTASRAQILKKAAEYIQFMRKKNNNVQSDIDEIAKQNKMLEDQIRRMEKAKNGGAGGGGSALSSLHLAGSSGSSTAAAAANGNAGGGSPLLYTEQIEVSTSYDTSEQDSNGSNSNGGGVIIHQQHGKPAKIGGGSFSGGISIISAASILNGGGGENGTSPNSSNSSSSSFTSSPSLATYSAGPSASASVLKSTGGTVLLNGSTVNGGGGSTLRPAVMHLAKVNGVGGVGGSTGTSKIIVQNPQHKNGGQPHVIHVTTSQAMLNGANITAMPNGKPILITNGALVFNGGGGGGQNGKCK